ncbi:hypothetical protein [uncultured Shewanella sp.]|nr:hypothetical protein [uncultured Shewanella sp.]
MTFEILESKKAEARHWKMEHLISILAQLTPLLLTEAVINRYSGLR